MPDLYALVEKLTPEKRRTLSARLKERGRDYNAFPLSFAQQRLWFLEQLAPDSPMYNIPVGLRFTGHMDNEALQSALDAVVRRHEVLRTTFLGLEGEPFQIVHPPAAAVLPVIDLRALPTPAREAAVLDHAQEEAHQPFDLAQGPLLRAKLLLVADDERVLLITMHHIISDGWSVGVLIRELTAFCWAYYAQGSPPPDLSIQYVDFAIWQRAPEQIAALARQLAYWKAQLTGAPSLLSLPTDAPRPPLQTYRGAKVYRFLPPTLVERVDALVHATDTTRFMALLTAFVALLHRITGEADIVVGTTIANRQRAELEALIGFFVNTLALRMDLSGTPTFHAMLARVREVTLVAYEHQDLPFERLVEEMHPERSLSHPPIFQVMFTYQNLPVQVAPIAGLDIDILDLHGDIAKYDVTFAVTELREGIRVALEYNTDLFRPETATRWLSHFETLLDAAVAAPEHPLVDLPLLSLAERTRLLTWAVAPAPYPQAHTIPAFFAETVATNAVVPALVWEDGQFTYADLDARVNRLAHALRQAGLRRGDIVGLYTQRTPALVVGLLGILKAGGAYLPLDPDYPAARLAYMLADSGAQWVVGQRGLDAACIVGPEVLWLDAEVNGLDGADTPLALDVTPDDLAYIIYTSGSTGKPKGVLVPHRGVVNLSEAWHHAFGITLGSRVLQFSSPSFDAAVSEIIPALLYGATLYLADTDTLRPGPEFLAYLERHAITHVTLPPSVLAALPDVELPALQSILSAGEACSVELVNRWAQGRHFYNGYGPTEVTVCATYAEVFPGASSPPIGGPLANQRVYVLDARGQLAPVGVFGELYVGGVGVTWGYLGRAALTAERFVPDAFSTEPGARLYRTGDVVRWRADGQLEFLGRSDHQVKVRGFRVELGEVEAALRAQPGVQDAVVVARQGQLIGYVTPEPGMALEGAVLRTALEQRLPAHTLPAIIMPLAALPLTPNGKVDRAALPAPVWAGTAAYTPPETPEEVLLADIWREVLGVAQVGRDADFFTLGGHSLLATQAVSRIASALAVNLPLRAIFESPTLRGLAAQVRAARQEAAGIVLPPITQVDGAIPQPLSFAQQRLWYLEQLLPGTGMYNLPAAVRLAGPLDADVMAAALNAVITRHASLRTTFHAEEGKPYQQIAPAETVALPVVDLSLIADSDLALQEQLRTEAYTPFDLQTGPLIRGTLFHLGEAQHVLLLTLHHIISDGWSMGVLVRELIACYRALALGSAIPLPELAVQYVDFAAWQREFLTGDSLEHALAYWKAQLTGAPELLALPLDFPRPVAPAYTGQQLHFTVAEPVVVALRALAAREGVTLFMVLLAAFDVLLARLSGQQDILVGTTLANRQRVELEPLIGFFVNTLVLRADLSGNPTFREVLTRIREMTLDAYAHQHVPFELVVDAVHPQRDLGRNPLFQVMFMLQNAPQTSLNIHELVIEPLEIPVTTAEFDLTLALTETPAGLSGTLEYSTELFQPVTMERFIARFEQLTAVLPMLLDQRLTALPVLLAEELQRLCGPWAGRSSPLTGGLVHERFAVHAQRAPEAVAVVWQTTALTYGDVNARANRLAWALHQQGVGPDTLVGIFMERSPEVLVAVLGVLKAGGAYLPLDVSYPPERLAFMLADAQPTVVLTTEAAANRLPATVARIMRLDSDPAIAAAPDATPPAVVIPEDSLAYVIYTSGSTGQPKGTLLTHRGLRHGVEAWAEAYALDNTRCFLQMASFSFDVFTEDWIRTLCFGGRLVLCPRELLLDPAQVYALLQQERIDSAEFVPVLIRGLMDYLETSGQRLDFMRLVIVGADVWYGREYARLRTLCGPQIQVVNSYGVTEVTIDNLYFDAAPEGLDAAAPTPIGRPFTHTQVYILDARGEPAPIGTVGELYIGGAGVARGYLGQPGLTATCFVPDHLSGVPGARLYRTGDVARFTAEGQVIFLGRSDAQVKVRGYRIELGEIEAVLETAPEVQEAVVVARQSGEATFLAAYVVPVSGAQPTAHALRDWVAQRLPDYMTPGAFMVLDALPVSPSGKVDRQALPEPERMRDTARPFIAPTSPKEEILAAIWARVLGVEHVGVHDSFFELGGDSLISMQIIAQANRAGLKLTPRQFLEHQTVAELAAVAEEVEHLQAAQGVVTGAVPLTPIQRLFFERDFAVPQHWNQAVLLEVREALPVAVLTQAIRAVFEHHDALRLRFYREADQVRQVNMPLGETDPLTVVDLTDIPAVEQEAALAAHATEAQASLDLEREIAHCIYFVGGVASPGWLLFVIHHLAVDGLSWRILVEDLETACQQAMRGQPVQLSFKTTAFKQWAEQLQAYADSVVLRKETAYWVEQARKTPAPLPVDYPEGQLANTVATAATVSVTLDEIETRALLQEAPTAYGVQINAVLLTALAQALEQWTGARRFLVDLEGHGREDLFAGVDVSRTVGWFTVVYPLLLELRHRDNLEEAIQRTQKQLDTAPYHGIGYGVLRYLSTGAGGVDELRQQPSAAISFNYLGQYDPGLTGLQLFGLSQLSPGATQAADNQREYLIEVSGMVVEGRMRWEWRYSRAVHDAATIEALASGYRAALLALLVQCSAAVAARHPSPVRVVLAQSRAALTGAALMFGHVSMMVRRRLAARHGSNVLTIQGRGELLPLFLVHPAGGNVLCYMKLARRLGYERPVYGLEALGLDDDAPLLKNIVEMARRYIAAMREVQPQGPYYLGGWSFGGVVAFEMARQLQARGERVDFLGLIDVSAPGYIPDEFHITLMQSLVAWIEQAHRKPLPLDWDALAAVPSEAQLEQVLAQVHAAGIGIPERELTVMKRQVLMHVTNVEAAESYVPGQYTGPLTMYRARDAGPRGLDTGHPDYDDPTWGWQRYTAQPVQVYPIPGHHEVLLDEPYVQELARAVADSLPAAPSVSLQPVPQPGPRRISVMATLGALAIMQFLVNIGAGLGYGIVLLSQWVESGAPTGWSTLRVSAFATATLTNSMATGAALERPDGRFWVWCGVLLCMLGGAAFVLGRRLACRGGSAPLMFMVITLAILPYFLLLSLFVASWPTLGGLLLAELGVMLVAGYIGVRRGAQLSR